MDNKTEFPIPDGVTEVADEYQLNLCHYELQHLKPKGTILFAKETKELNFRFIAGANRAEGIYARLEDGMTPSVRRIMDYLEKYPRTECFIQMTLLQFKLIFVANQVNFVKGSQQKTLHFPFPEKLLKTHRRKFIRIPFNEQFPAELRFQTADGMKTCKVKDLSREGARIQIQDGDAQYLEPGSRLKLATLKVLNKEMPLGLQIVSHYPGNQVGLKIIAISEEDKAWIKDCIRILMKQILNLPDMSDQIEKS
jgi:hypothetical protein